MANREACELWIEQEIDSGLEAGKTPYTIGKEVSGWVAKLFETAISPELIKSRARRQQAKIGSNDPKKFKTVDNQGSTGDQPKFKSRKSTPRPNAGRPAKNDPDHELTKNRLMIELNNKISEFHEKETEYINLKQKFAEKVANDPELQASIMYGIILSAIRVIEKQFDIAKEKNTATHIPKSKQTEFLNRWGKVRDLIENRRRAINEN